MAVPRSLRAVWRAGAIITRPTRLCRLGSNVSTAGEEKSVNNLRRLMSVYEESVSDVGLGS